MNLLTLSLAVLLQVLAVLALSVLPAWWLVRPLRLDLPTRLLISVMASYVLLYMLEAGAYLSGLPQWVPALLCVGACLGSLLRIATDGASIRERFPWVSLAVWTSLALILVAIQCRIVTHGHPLASTDWFDHYRRSIVFLDQLPPRRVGVFGMSSRGPMFNSVAALMMFLLRKDGYWTYQIVATVLNSFAVIPMALLLRDLGRQRTVVAWVSSVLLFVSVPFFFWNQTFTWTKFFATGFVLGAIQLYCAGMRNSNRRLASWSFFAFAAGFLAHYMAAPYAAMFGLHFAYRVAVERWPWRTWVPALVACVVLVTSWFGFLQLVHGQGNPLGTYYKPIEASGYMPEDAGRFRNLAKNIATTVVPYSWLRTEAGLRLGLDPGLIPEVTWTPDGTSDPVETAAYDWARITNIEGVFHRVGLLVLLLAVVLLLGGRFVGDRGTPQLPGRWFWTLFFVVGIPLSMVPIRWESGIGVASVTAHGFVCLAVVLAASCLNRLPRWLRLVVFAAFLLDCGRFTWALVRLQEHVPPVAGEPSLVVPLSYVQNYEDKMRWGAVYLSDVLGGNARGVSVLIAALGVGLLLLAAGCVLRADDGRQPPAG